MKLQFEHNEGDLNELRSTKKHLLDDVARINKKKLLVVKAFAAYMEAHKDKNNEHKVKEFLEDMAAMGGKVSGLTRAYKHDLMMYMLKIYSQHADNKYIFDYFTSMNYREFSRYLFDSSPKKESVLDLIVNKKDWNNKNAFYKEFSRKPDFIEYLRENHAGLRSDEPVIFFLKEYDTYRNESAAFGRKVKEEMIKTKKSLKKTKIKEA